MVIVASAVDLEAEEGIAGFGVVPFEEIGEDEVEAVEVFIGEIGAAACCVFDEIAEDVGELEGNATVFGKLECVGIVAVSPDGEAHSTDRGGDAVAVTVKIVEGSSGSGGEIVELTFDHGDEVGGVDVEAVDGVDECGPDWGIEFVLRGGGCEGRG